MSEPTKSELELKLRERIHSYETEIASLRAEQRGVEKALNDLLQTPQRAR